jgi:hypothetical protein
MRLVGGWWWAARNAPGSGGARLAIAAALSVTAVTGPVVLAHAEWCN